LEKEGGVKRAGLGEREAVPKSNTSRQVGEEQEI
jgi:hypothetical protein